MITGGCQCGAVRYAYDSTPEYPHICHCRMCQKAVGNYFAAFTACRRDGFRWTRGAPASFRSSTVATRGFCRDCGAPLFFAYDGSDYLGITIGSLDDPAVVTPDRQFGVESRQPAFAILHGLPEGRTEDDMTPERAAKMRSFQHPDGGEPA